MLKRVGWRLEIFEFCSAPIHGHSGLPCIVHTAQPTSIQHTKAHYTSVQWSTVYDGTVECTAVQSIVLPVMYFTWCLSASTARRKHNVQRWCIFGKAYFDQLRQTAVVCDMSFCGLRCPYQICESLLGPLSAKGVQARTLSPGLLKNLRCGEKSMVRTNCQFESLTSRFFWPDRSKGDKS